MQYYDLKKVMVYMLFVIFLLLFYPFCISFIKAVNVDIQGIIHFNIDTDLDESTSSGNKRKDNKKYSDSSSEYSKKMTKGDVKKLINILLNDANFRETKPYKIREIEDLNNFTSKVLKRSLRTLKKINDHVDNRLKSKVKRLAVMYQVKFSHNLNESLDHIIRTRFGLQKFMLNTLRTSDNILQRLKNNLIYDLNKSHNLGIRSNTSEYINNHINETKYLQLQYICMNYNICESNVRFSMFLANLAFMVTHSMNITKMKVQRNSFVNYLSKANVSKHMNETTMQNFYQVLNFMQMWSDNKIRDTFIMVFHMLVYPTKPVAPNGTQFAKHIVPLFEIITLLDKCIPPSNGTKSRWSCIEKVYSEWIDAKISDNVIDNITKAIFEEIEDGIHKMRKETLEFFKRQIAIICQYYEIDYD
nr:uncharacterized protein LOC128681190 isoform X1 [Plodia interpunctella]